MIKNSQGDNPKCLTRDEYSQPPGYSHHKPPLVGGRPLTRGQSPPRKFFAPLEKYVGHNLKVLDIV